MPLDRIQRKKLAEPRRRLWVDALAVLVQMAVPAALLTGVHALAAAQSLGVRFIGEFILAGFAAEITGLVLGRQSLAAAAGNLALSPVLGLAGWLTTLYALSRGGGAVDPALLAWLFAMLIAFWHTT